MYKLLLICILAFFAFEICSQIFSYDDSKQKVQAEKLNKEISSIKKVVKVEGWDIPLNKELSSTVTKQSKVFEGISLLMEERGIEEKFIFNYDSYQIGEDATLYTGSLPCEPASITALKIEQTDKIFGYGMVCSIVVLDENGKVKKNTLSAYPIFYYDENNDGKFESRYYSANLPSLPDWVKQIAKPKNN